MRQRAKSATISRTRKRSPLRRTYLRESVGAGEARRQARSSSHPRGGTAKISLCRGVAESCKSRVNLTLSVDVLAESSALVNGDATEDAGGFGGSDDVVVSIAEPGVSEAGGGSADAEALGSTVVRSSAAGA